jgi:hypothetical protein
MKHESYGEIPGKTKAELDKDCEELRKEVDEAMKAWSTWPHKMVDYSSCNKKESLINRNHIGGFILGVLVTFFILLWI